MGTTGAPYNLSYPEDGDIADVPQDILELATGVVTALDTKLGVDDAIEEYQPKILVATSLPVSPVPNQIVFIVSA